MPPKKSHKAEPTAAQVAKQAQSEAAEAERLAAIGADPLVIRHSETTPALTVSELFERVVQRKTFRTRNTPATTESFDWTVFKQEVAKRNAHSPVWFVQIRVEDLILDPDGRDGEKVEVAIIVEGREPSLAPMHMVYREAREYSDAEDNTPERIVYLKDLGLCWREIRSDAGEELNMFVLQFASSKPSAPAGSSGFSFGAPKPAALPAAAPACPTAAPGGSAVTFGTTAPPAFASTTAPAVPRFGFGAAAPAPSTTSSAPQLRFGSAPNGATSSGATTPPPPSDGGMPKAGFPQLSTMAPAAAAAVTAVPSSFASGFGGPKKPVLPKVTEVGLASFTLWTDKRLKDMKKELQSGSRIVIDGFYLPAPVNRTIKLQMQNDLHDSISETVAAIVRREFARLNGEMRKLDQWIDDCPIYDPKFAEAIAKMRDRQLAQVISEGGSAPTLSDVESAIAPLLRSKLEECVSLRKKVIAAEIEVIDDIQLLLKKRLLLPKEHFRVLKYYPANDVLLFRPFGKVTGIHEAGEAADLCVPPAYHPPNPLNPTKKNSPQLEDGALNKGNETL